MHTITNTEITDFMADAKKLKVLYDKENKKGKGKPFDYGGVHNIALKLFEKKYGVVVIGVKCKNENVKLHTIGGRVINEDIYYLSQRTEDFAFEKMNKKGPAVGFASYICKELQHRGNNGIPVIKNMIPDTRKYIMMGKKIQRWAS